MIAGYGLGGSTVALFGRVGGGIYTKAADVGAEKCSIGDAWVLLGCCSGAARVMMSL